MLACIFVKNRNSTASDGPYKVIVRNGRVMKVLIKGKVERSLWTELNLHTSSASQKQVQQQSVKRNRKRRIRRLPGANGSDGGLRTYSRVGLLLHLRGQTSTTPDTPKILGVRNKWNIADSEKIISYTTVKHTRVGQKIHTPARFVQMVHAIVAPNDIYGGTNCPYRNKPNL